MCLPHDFIVWCERGRQLGGSTLAHHQVLPDVILLHPLLIKEEDSEYELANLAGSRSRQTRRQNLNAVAAQAGAGSSNSAAYTTPAQTGQHALCRTHQ